MINQDVIQSSKLRVASIHIMWVCFSMIWPLLYMFAIYPADHIGVFFKTVFAVCALASGAFVLSAGWAAWRILSTPGDWKATIGAGRLKWEAAIAGGNLPLELALGDITKAVRLDMIRTGEDTDGEYTEWSERYELHLTSDRILTFDREATGINPHRVFLALARHGVQYELWTQDRTKTSEDTSRLFKSCY
jgi:hypothetical protein